MKYANRVRKLEEAIGPIREPPHIVVHFIHPIRGLVSALDRMTQTCLERGDDEAEEQFKDRVRQTTEGAVLENQRDRTRSGSGNRHGWRPWLRPRQFLRGNGARSSSL